MSGGYDYEVVEDVKPDLYCVICLNLMKDAMQLECPHGMCNFCFQSLSKSSKDRNVEFLCPNCRAPIDEDKVRPAGMVNRMILSVKVKCVNTKAGCEWTGEVSNMKDHQNNFCEYQIITCDFEGCNLEVRKAEILEHKKSCNFRLVLCDYCQESHVYNDIPTHLRTCLLYPVICANACGEIIPRNKIANHYSNECFCRPVDCMFKHLGCDVQVAAGELDKHMSTALQNHLSLVMKDSLETKHELKETQKKLMAAEAELVEVKKELHHSVDSMKEQFTNGISYRDCLKNRIGIDDSVISNSIVGMLEKKYNSTFNELKLARSMKDSDYYSSLIITEYQNLDIEKCLIDVEKSFNKEKLSQVFRDAWKNYIRNRILIRASFYHVNKTQKLINYAVEQLRIPKDVFQNNAEIVIQVP